jgi:hypothetical protein
MAGDHDGDPALGAGCRVSFCLSLADSKGLNEWEHKALELSEERSTLSASR